ncbi:MAG: sodium-dependent transporter [Xanthomonadales bacterium]|nr:sodium-dependent transporter [Xanthomonadales bacterium]
MQPVAERQAWSSRIVFLMAAVGAAVGLGNVWKFPYVAGVNGGGAFVLVYLLAVLLVAIPILIGETMLGRMGRRSPPETMRHLARERGRSGAWAVVGWLGMLAAYLILTYYSVIAGWTVAYVFKAGSGALDAISAEAANGLFNELLADPVQMLIWHGLFMLLTVVIVGQGLEKGIERAVKVLMPMLFVFLLIMVAYAAVNGDPGAAVAYLFDFDFSRITPQVALIAVGQAFFSISVGIGLMMIYGAYLPQDFSIARGSVFIAAADTLVALLAGLAIFPLVFANGLDPGEGPGLIFVTFPLAVGGMPASTLFGTLFFALMVFAAVTSTIAIMEPMVSWAAEKFGMGRSMAAAIAGFVAWVLGIGSILSFNAWAGFYPLDFIPVFSEATVFALVDYVTANVMMPVGALLMAVFVGWILSPAALEEELAMQHSWLFQCWLWLIRGVAPLALLLVFVVNLV